VPRVVGLPLAEARARLRAAGLVVAAPDGAQNGAVVVRQFPHAGVAAAPRMHVSLLVRAAAG
jgi:beta-lactam-binding protein with PASTA domain